MITYKDLFFTIYCILWFINTCIVLCLTNDISYVNLTNLAMIGIFGIITFIKCCSSKFNNWLSKPLKK
jgi:hypothetical protein